MPALSHRHGSAICWQCKNIIDVPRFIMGLGFFAFAGWMFYIVVSTVFA